ncbi:Similar to APN2: Aminopeptidase N (Manduca sexta) [Cotesia congregata]|uniref:Similar to APN2: Aminopeptidase N (Manduca sexta) n=1 Tax=Cotesia congregata TaxID=51543 RepID=A0A8J2H4V4_COTCN|nr:Similar to APN2: Aminopeptidase N (Manduca sexta) [Cotesia congregata]
MRPGLFGNKLELKTNIATRRDSSKTDTLKVPFAKTTTYQRSFIVTGCNFWNSLPIEITSAATLEEFRNVCFRFLQRLEQVNEHE